MIFKDLIKDKDFSDIWGQMIRYSDPITKENFEKNSTGYKLLFEELKQTPTIKSNFIVFLDEVLYDDEPKTYDKPKIFLLSEVDDKENRRPYCLGLSDRNEWVSLEVVQCESNQYYDRLVVACLYEMTFYGFTTEQLEISRLKLEATRPSSDEYNPEDVVNYLNEIILDTNMKDNSDCFSYINQTTDEYIAFKGVILWSYSNDGSKDVIGQVLSEYRNLLNRMKQYDELFQKKEK